MGPLVVEEARDAPEHAEGFDGAGGFGGSHVGGLPAELVEDGGDLGLGLRVAAADEHGGLAFLVRRVDHAGVADGVEGFDEVGLRELGLEGFEQGFVGAGEEAEDSVGGRGVFDWVGGVDDCLALEVVGAGFAEGFGGDRAFDGEDDDVAEAGDFGEGSGLGAGVGGLPVGELGGGSGAEHDLVVVLEESAAEGFGYFA